MENFLLLAGMFGAAFTAATPIPMQSEAYLVMMLLNTNIQPFVIIAAASAGSVLGAWVNWYLGSCAERYKDRKWFPASARDFEKAKYFYQKYGRWSILLCWVPFIGDPITIMAGVMKEKLWFFLMLASIAKTGRYVVIAYATISMT